MIYEYALEPELVASWGNLSDYRFFVQAFGLGQPRLMSEFPKLKNWRRQVLRALKDPKGMKAQRVTALIEVLSEKMISRQHGGYDGTAAPLRRPHRHIARY
jgi:hypothetical protein